MGLVSVIVPVYNCEKYLHRCVDSIVHQTYTKLEILLIDDGSTDFSGKICDEYVQLDSRIQVIHKENGGVSQARNAGIDRAIGDYICFVDSDDWIELDTIGYLYSLIDKNDRYSVSACDYDLKFSDSVGKGCVVLRKNGIYYGEQAFQYVWDVPFSVNKMYSTDAIRKGGIRFNEHISFAEDSLFCFQVMEVSKSIIVGSDIKYHYFQENTDAASQSAWSIKRVHSLLGYEYMATKAKKLKLKNLRIYQCGYVSQCIRMLLHREISNDKKTFVKIRKKIRKYIVPYLFTNASRLKGNVRVKFKLLGMLYTMLPYRLGSRIAKY